MSDKGNQSAHVEAGLKAFRNEDYDNAAHHFENARTSYLEQNEDLLAAEMANNLSVTYLQLDRVMDAIQVVEGTPQRFLSAGERELAGRAYGNLASALEANQQHQEALETYQLAASILADEGDNENYALVMQSISRIQLRLGQPVEAVSTMQAGLEASPNRGIRDRILRKLIDIPNKIMGN